MSTRATMLNRSAEREYPEKTQYVKMKQGDVNVTLLHTQGHGKVAAVIK
jgi:hypothetical protein